MLNEKSSLLLVDDNSLILEAYSAVLRSVGYTVQTAENGVEALKSLREHVPDLILSDLDMPVMSGFEFLSIVPSAFFDRQGGSHERGIRGEQHPRGSLRRCVLSEGYE